MANAPYHRLRPGLLSPLWKQMRPYIRHRGLFTLVHCTKFKEHTHTACCFQHNRSLSFRCERSCFSPDSLWGSGDNSGSSPWGAAPPPTARGQQRRLIHAEGLSPQLETKRQRVLTFSHATHTLPPWPPYTGRRGQFPAMAASAVCVTGDSAQRGPIRQRWWRDRRRPCLRAIPCSTRGFTGER